MKGYNMPKNLAVTDEQVLKAAAVTVTGDLGDQTLTDYLKSLLETLWEEEEEFSGKRPFGNSGWKYDVFAGFVRAGLISGKISPEDGWVEECDTKTGDAIVLAVIKRFVIKG